MDLDLKDVHVLVTGANGGIGLATTKLFLTRRPRDGHFRSSDAELVPLTHVYPPTRLRLAQADFAHEDQVQAVFSQSKSGDTELWGEVEVAVVNHATFAPADVPLKDMTRGRWEQTFTDNLTSSFLVAREYLRGLERGVASRGGDGRYGQRAALVLVGSTAGKYGEANHADYAASKSALMYGFTLSLKNEIVQIAPRARVNCVAPGWVRTPMANDALKNPKTVYRALATTPLKKIADAADVANQIVLLSSAKVSGHVSGQVLMVEGGMEGRLLNMPADLGLEVQ
ncbi:NAD-P-binding protein [Gloeopeniophorella convolvens]|nr:NAD-P-binding protein [Gloeopeniophorella convolvens]